MFKKLTILSLIVILNSCAILQTEKRSAVSVIRAIDSGKSMGHVTFTEIDGMKVKVEINLSNMKGTHAIHVHEHGDLRHHEVRKKGGYFRPHSAHGEEEGRESHVGDLGDITANKKGLVNKVIIDDHLSLRRKHSIIGRSVIIHKNTDEKILHSGKTGKRVAAGVIGFAAE